MKTNKPITFNSPDTEIDAHAPNDEALGFEHHEWRSESAIEKPKKWRVISDQTKADQALAWAQAGEGLIWTGDFQNAKQLLTAMSKRWMSKKQTVRQKSIQPAKEKSILERFHIHRLHQSQRLNLLSKLLIPIEPSYRIPLKRAPQVHDALIHALGASSKEGHYLMSLREILGFIGAFEWFKNGLEFDERYFAKAPLNKIHPYYGVFSPIRGEYLSLVHQAPVNLKGSPSIAFDIGVGTGILSAMLVQRGFRQVIATDNQERAISCATENLSRLGLLGNVNILKCDLFPPGKANLIVCNPPWLPGKARSSIESAVYDENSQMLKGFLKGLKAHLEPKGVAWLIMSDLAERLGLRAPGELQGWIHESGLQVIDVMHTRPTHPKAKDEDDPLFEARSEELTSLWRLEVQPGIKP